MSHRRTPRATPAPRGAGRVIPGNGHVVATVVYEPDAWSVQAASLGLATNTFSPMSAGRHSPGASPRGFVGDRGYGVNRWAGRTPYQQGAVQALGAPVQPILTPLSQRLGIGAMPAGQPGFPSTGQDDGGLAALAAMGYGGLNNRTGLGG